MPITRKTIIVAVLLVIGAACAGPQSDAGPGCPETAPSPLPTPPYDDDPELASRLPSEIAGQELDVQSACVTAVDPGGLNLSQQFLDRVGVELADVTMAVSQPPAISQDAPFATISAFRYRGAGEEAIRSAFTTTFADAGLDVDEETIAEKEVYRVLVVVWYVADDTLYAITGEAPQVEEILQALPD